MSGTDSDTDVGQNALVDERDVDEEHMDDSDDSREYSVATSNSYSALGGDGSGL